MSHAKGRIAAVVTSVVAIVALSNIPATAADQVESVASATLPANSVTSTTVVNGSLYQQDINPTVVGVLRTPKQNSVTGWSIKDGTVLLNDLSPSVQDQVTQGRLVNIAGVAHGFMLFGNQSATIQRATVACPFGKFLLNGGYRHDSGNIADLKGIQILTSTPVTQFTSPLPPTEYIIEALNNGTADVHMIIFANCARLTS
jgi:hypothetical protein